MSRTLDIISQKETELMDILTSTEEEKGISGYFAMKEAAMSPGNSFGVNESTQEDLTASIKRINDSINKKKAELNPVVKELKPLRQRAQELTSEHDKKKMSYDSTAAGLEAALNKINLEVKKLRQQLNSLESESFKTKCDLEVVSSLESLLMKESKEIERPSTSQQAVQSLAEDSSIM